MQSEEIYRILTEKFAMARSNEQDRVLRIFSGLISGENDADAFVMKGYAGTGKTSIIASVVKTLGEIKGKCILLAPTGRAAKVMSRHSGKRAFTIHKYIYSTARDEWGAFSFSLRKNRSKNTFFIVDEASMITDRAGDSYSFTNSSLLDDLVGFVSQGQNCKLILVGDDAQLPPVGYSESPALDAAYISSKYGLAAVTATLREVFRQQEGSGVLENATRIRRAIERGETKWGKIRFKPAPDFVRLQDGYDVQDAISGSLANTGAENTIVITRSNKRANLFNQQIRCRVMLREGELSAGDMLMVTKNNYFWMDEKTSKCGFIANGDMAEVLKIVRFEELYGKRFARAEIRLADYPEDGVFEAVLLLDTLYLDAPSFSGDQMKAFLPR